MYLEVIGSKGMFTRSLIALFSSFLLLIHASRALSGGAHSTAVMLLRTHTNHHSRIKSPRCAQLSFLRVSDLIFYCTFEILIFYSVHFTYSNKAI
jgi:hypothetical protein